MSTIISGRFDDQDLANTGLLEPSVTAAVIARLESQQYFFRTPVGEMRQRHLQLSKYYPIPGLLRSMGPQRIKAQDSNNYKEERDTVSFLTQCCGTYVFPDETSALNPMAVSNDKYREVYMFWMLADGYYQARDLVYANIKKRTYRSAAAKRKKYGNARMMALAGVQKALNEKGLLNHRSHQKRFDEWYMQMLDWYRHAMGIDAGALPEIQEASQQIVNFSNKTSPEKVKHFYEEMIAAGEIAPDV